MKCLIIDSCIILRNNKKLQVELKFIIDFKFKDITS